MSRIKEPLSSGENDGLEQFREQRNPLKNRPLIVLTPVRNEEWRIRGFLNECLSWADHVILSDQNSTDNTAEIASSYERVSVIRNDSEVFNELVNRRMLLSECRRRFGDCIVFSLDADECLTSEILNHEVKRSLQHLKPGTGIQISHANLTDGMYWEVALDPIAFVDDGRIPDVEEGIHFPRTCFRSFPEGIVRLPVLALHLQYLELGRYKSKMDWYQLLEVTHLGRQDFVSLYRQYHHFDSIRRGSLKPVPSSFVEGYKQRGVDALVMEGSTRPWWSTDMEKMSLELRADLRSRVVLSSDPMSLKSAPLRDNLFRLYLAKTQPWYRPSALNPVFVMLYLIDRMLSPFWRSQ